MANIMESLREDHSNMLHLFDLLEEQCEALKGDADADYGILHEAINYCLTYPDLYHHPKEDRIYQKMLEHGASPEQIGDMEAAHHDLAGLTRRMAAAVDVDADERESNREALAELAQRFIDSYRLHIDAEEKVFFPLAEKLLGPADWDAIEASMKRVNDPLFGERPTSDYQRLKGNLKATREPAESSPHT